MGKQTKSRKTENFGKGKVTPVQVAFIVDRYLFDNNYPQTRSTFRTEASILISKSPIQEAPKSLLSLGAMLDEYICLKEERVLLDQEKHLLEQEKIRVQTLLRGMQDVMNAYNNTGSTPSLNTISSIAPNSAALIPQIDLTTTGSPSGYPVYNTPVMMSASRPPNTRTDPSKFSTPVTTHQTSKRRKGSKEVPDGPISAKKSRITTNQLPIKGNDMLTQSRNTASNQKIAQHISVIQSSPHDSAPNGSPVQGSSVAKCLFNQSNQSPPTNSSGPRTPPRATSSQADKSVSPLEISSTATSSENVNPQQIIYTNRTVISSEKIRVSPVKQIAFYSIERNQCVSISPIKTNLKLSKRDHVKGRLDFDGSDKPVNSEILLDDGLSVRQTNNEVEVFDLDLPNFDALGFDFSLSELLVDFDLDGEGFDYSCQPSLGSPAESLSGSINESADINLGANQVLSEFSSTVTEILPEKDTNIQAGLDYNSVTSVKSITTFPSAQEELSARS